MVQRRRATERPLKLWKKINIMNLTYQNLEQIVEEEEKWLDYGLQKLRNNIYFPGFFVIFGVRT